MEIKEMNYKEFKEEMELLDISWETPRGYFVKPLENEEDNVNET